MPTFLHDCGFAGPGPDPYQGPGMESCEHGERHRCIPCDRAAWAEMASRCNENPDRDGGILTPFPCPTCGMDVDGFDVHGMPREDFTRSTDPEDVDVTCLLCGWSARAALLREAGALVALDDAASDGANVGQSFDDAMAAMRVIVRALREASGIETCESCGGEAGHVPCPECEHTS